jgi:AcrR family transcriptional regulator
MTRRSTRDRILAAAKELFYKEGIRSVGIDAIVTRAGVTKPTLYYYFESKDALVAAYLDGRNEAILSSLMETVENTRGSAADRIAAIFASIAKATPNPRWKGCPIVRGAAEFAADPEHAARQIASSHKKRVEAWLTRFLEEENVAEPNLKGRQLAVLLDGAVMHAFMHGDPEYAEAAGTAARRLIEG